MRNTFWRHLTVLQMLKIDILQETGNGTDLLDPSQHLSKLTGNSIRRRTTWTQISPATYFEWKFYIALYIIVINLQLCIIYMWIFAIVSLKNTSNKCKWIIYKPQAYAFKYVSIEIVKTFKPSQHFSQVNQHDQTGDGQFGFDNHL